MKSFLAVVLISLFSQGCKDSTDVHFMGAGATVRASAEDRSTNIALINLNVDVSDFLTELVGIAGQTEDTNGDGVISLDEIPIGEAYLQSPNAPFCEIQLTILRRDQKFYLVENGANRALSKGDKLTLAMQFREREKFIDNAKFIAISAEGDHPTTIEMKVEFIYRRSLSRSGPDFPIPYSVTLKSRAFFGAGEDEAVIDFQGIATKSPLSTIIDIPTFDDIQSKPASREISGSRPYKTNW